jgi:hypothetical protein
MNLLPRDQYTLFVPPAGRSFRINEEFRLYWCPAAWNRRKAKYLGVYNERLVRAIGRIKKVVACDVDLAARKVTVLADGETPTPDEEERIIGAAQKAQQRGWDITTGHKFYLCDQMQETAFRKTSPGGIWGHRYFDLETVLGGQIPNGLGELAGRLRGCTWE